MKLKKLIAMGLATTMLLATTACANGEANETPAPDAAPNGATQITYWHSMDGVFGEIVNKQVEAFNSTIGQEKKYRGYTSIPKLARNRSINSCYVNR